MAVKRLASQIRLIISDALQNKLADPRLERLASITRVEISLDMSFADVYISVMGTEGQQGAYMTALRRAHGLLQSMVARKTRTRTCPTLRFHLDQSLKKGFETIKLIDKVAAELAERQGPQIDQQPSQEPEPGNSSRSEKSELDK